MPESPGEPGAATLWARFVAVATTEPEREALRWNGGTLCYGALFDRARRIAGVLRARHGIGPGACVGVAMPRDGDLVAALLGVMASGAAYVPLDPRYPLDRLGFMVADSGASLVLSHSRVALPPGVSRQGGRGHAWQRRGADRLGNGGIFRGRAWRHARLDFGLFRSVGV
ncbi:MAG: AMP-binding protein [Novosphingobium sp.]